MSKGATGRRRAHRRRTGPAAASGLRRRVSVDDRGRRRRERAIERLALGQIVVVGGGQERVSVATHKAFSIAVVHVEVEAFHGGGGRSGLGGS